MATGSDLAAALAEIDVGSVVNESDQVSVLVAHNRLVSHYQGRVCEDISALESKMRGGRETAYHHSIETVSAEVGAALHLTRRAAEAESHLALDLVRRLPEVHQALLRGEIDLRRAKTLAQGTDHLSDHSARRAVSQVIDDAGELTTGQLAARLRRVCMEAMPDEAAERYRRRVEDRRVVVGANPEGTANISAWDLPPDRAAAIGAYLDRAARKLRHKGEPRSMDQLRADVFVDILEGAHTPLGGNPLGALHLEVDLATLAGLDDKAGEIAGFGPITADLARQIADQMHDQQWTFSVTDPETGEIVCDGTTRRRPQQKQRRRLQARDKHCVWLGCRMPSVDCDMDHRVRHVDGGCGHDHNLAPLCRAHHRLRHEAGWRYRRLPNGDHEWTSGTGRTYLTRNRSP